jgi:hypothetical protein
MKNHINGQHPTWLFLSFFLSFILPSFSVGSAPILSYDPMPSTFQYISPFTSF